MDLVVFGDSWTYGDELIPDTPIYRNSVNIGGLVNKDYVFNQYHNLSVNGASLQHIILQILTYINSDDYSSDNLVLVGLTSPMRRLRFNNLSKGPTNSSTHDWSEYCNYGDISLVNSKVFETWWKTNNTFHVNVRNDLLTYFNACCTIKSLLASHSKYIIWQSIDGNLYDKVENGFNEIIGDYENNKSTYIEHYDNTSVFNKDLVRNTILKNLSPTQQWLNFDNSSWMDVLHSTNDTSLIVKGGMHPSEAGIQYWYTSFLKKYIHKVLDM